MTSMEMPTSGKKAASTVVAPCMRAVVYSQTGDAGVLRVVEREKAEPGPGEVRVRIAVSGVNPTDWKARSAGSLAFDEVVPNQDGSGVIDAIGDGVTGFSVGDRVWTMISAYQRPTGTAQEYTVLPVDRIAPLSARCSSTWLK